MIHTDGIRTIANGEPRVCAETWRTLKTASRLKALAPNLYALRVRQGRLPLV